MKLDKQ